MTTNELIDWLEQEEHPVIAFDTNAVFGNHQDSQFMKLCDVLNHIDRRRRPHKIRKVLSAAVYMEKLHDLRQHFGEDYDHSLIDGFLESKNIEVIAFAKDHAEHAAELIGRCYPDREAWHGFKRQRCLDCLGLTELAAAPEGTGRSCGASIDWLVAGHADGGGCLLVTDDTGPEFQQVVRQNTLAELLAAATALLDRLETPTPPS